MKWSFRIGSLAGIGIYVHATFALILIWVGAIYYTQTGDPMQTAYGVAFVLVLFGCVVLHELGHALTARRFGYRTRDITLLPIGGVARLERMPEDPAQEFAVAIAGPLVNVAIFAGLAAVLAALGVSILPIDIDLVGGNLLVKLAWINLFLAAFNMLPAFPMDGGRMLRAFLGRYLGFTRATKIAATVGQAMAFVFGGLGLISGNVVLLFIAFFVYMAAAEEAALVQMRSVFHGISVDDAMLTRFRAVRADESLGRVAEYLIDATQHDFPVTENGRPIGVLTRQDLIKGLREHGEEAEVAVAMRPEIPSVQASDQLDAVLTPISTREAPMLAVMRGDELVGLLTLENIGEYVMIHTALNDARFNRTPGRPPVRL